MSILIKGMEMPSCCGECRFLSEYGDYPVCIITDEQRGYNFRIRELKMPNCPLVPVPSHGRLIDADALPINDPIRSMMVFGGEIVIAKSAIDEAPTIIPAEEGDT